MRDIQTGTVQPGNELTGVKGSGVIGGVAFGATGRYVFLSFLPTGSSSTSAPNQLFVHDLVAGTTHVVSLSDTGSHVSISDMAISADGRYIAFSSNSPKLSPEGFLPGTEIFLRGPLQR